MKFHAFRLHLKPKIHIMLNLHCPKLLSKKKRGLEVDGGSLGCGGTSDADVVANGRGGIGGVGHIS